MFTTLESFYTGDSKQSGLFSTLTFVCAVITVDRMHHEGENSDTNDAFFRILFLQRSLDPMYCVTAV